MARVSADTSVQSPSSIQPPRPQAASSAPLDDAFTQMLDAATAETARPASEPAPRPPAERAPRNDAATARSRRDDRAPPPGNRAAGHRPAESQRPADRAGPRDNAPNEAADTKPASRETAEEAVVPGKPGTGDGNSPQGEETAATPETNTDTATVPAAMLIEIAAAQATTPTVDPSLEGGAATVPATTEAAPGETAPTLTPATTPVAGLVDAAATAAAGATGTGAADAPGAGKGGETPATTGPVIAARAAEQKPAADAAQPETQATTEQGLAPPAEADGEPKAEKADARDGAQAKPAQPIAKDQPGQAPQHRPEALAALIPTADAAANPGHATGQTHAAAMASSNALNAPASAQGAAHGVPGSSAASSPGVPVEGVAVEITTRFAQGNKRFEIRLDPPELGRIDVRLDVDKEGQVTSRLVVDKVETLELLRRDASQLERALQQAGLKMGDSGLQFQLRDQSFAGHQQQEDRPQQSSRLVATDPDMPVSEVASGYGRMLGGRGGLDIRV